MPKPLPAIASCRREDRGLRAPTRRLRRVIGYLPLGRNATLGLRVDGRIARSTVEQAIYITVGNAWR